MWKIASAFALLIVVAVGAFGQAPTLRIVTDDPTLPSELFYGDVKVKPLRLRPGTNQQITIDDSDFFVTQQYVDFLSRFPEQSGFDAWLNYLNSEQQRCGANCLHEARIEASSGFFRSDEFNLKGGYVFRFFKLGLRQELPLYPDMVAGMRAVTGTTGAEVEQKKALFAANFVARADFKALFPTSLSPTDFVDSLLQGTSIANRQTIIANLTAGSNTDAARAIAMRAVVDSPEITAREFNPSFVYMQYVGYLRRAPERGGYDAWLGVLRDRPGDFRIMVQGFMDSPEYRNRF